MVYEEIVLPDAYWAGDYMSADITSKGGIGIEVNAAHKSSIVLLTPEDSLKLATFISENVKKPEVAEVPISLLEALAELKAGKNVKVVYFGKENIIEPEHDFEVIWTFTNLSHPEDLLESSFYKVSA